MPTPLDKLRQVVATCTACRLHKDRTQAVFDRGNPTAPLMIVGEAPGEDEDRTGLAFVGRAGKHMTRLLRAARVPDDAYYAANVLKCLSFHSRVKLPDGSSMEIGKLVKQRYAGEVMTVDPDTGEIGTARVTGWHKSKLGGRRLFKLRYRYGKRTGNGYAGVVVTHDHKILTQRGWIEAEQIRPSDLVATGDPAPGNANIEQIILGTLLGDACVTKQLQIAHTVKQAEWFGLKATALSGFGGKVSRVPQNNAVAFTSKAGAYWRCMRDTFYPDGKKRVPVELLPRLRELGLAVWYCDDGSLREREGRQPHASIATNSFSEEEVRALCDHLRTFGVKAKVRYGSGWRIKMGVEATKVFAALIAPYVPPSMRYKLPEQFREVPFDSSVFAPASCATFWDVPILEPWSIKEKTVYCIDVEGTHSFVTPGGVVHNCRPDKNRFPEGNEPEICRSYLVRQVKLVEPKAVIVTGKQALRYLLLWGTHEEPDPLHPWINKMFRRRDLYGDILFLVCYHPSYLLRTEIDEDEEAWVQSVALLWSFVEHKLAGTPPAPVAFEELRPAPSVPRMGRNLFGQDRGRVL